MRQAYTFASRAHDGQERMDGKPYISHPLEVAKILVEMNMDTDSICAALMHDVLEDCDIEKKNIDKVLFEASSIGIDQGRLDGMPIKHAVYLNLSRDHLDYHRNYESYLQAKRMLIENEELETLVFNSEFNLAVALVKGVGTKKPKGLHKIHILANFQPLNPPRRIKFRF